MTTTEIRKAAVATAVSHDTHLSAWRYRSEAGMEDGAIVEAIRREGRTDRFEVDGVACQLVADKRDVRLWVGETCVLEPELVCMVRWVLGVRPPERARQMEMFA